MAEMAEIKGDELFGAIREIGRKKGVSSVKILTDRATVVLEDGRIVDLAIRFHCGTKGIEIKAQGEEFFSKLTGKESIVSVFERILLES